MRLTNTPAFEDWSAGVFGPLGPGLSAPAYPPQPVLRAQDRRILRALDALGGVATYAEVARECNRCEAYIRPLMNALHRAAYIGAQRRDGVMHYLSLDAVRAGR